MKIRHIYGKMPRAGTWEDYLAQAELREECNGVRLYGITNCNYLVFPSGLLLTNFGWQGAACIRRIKEHGIDAFLATLAI